VDRIEDALARVMPRPRMLEFSARSGEGMDRWIAWLEERRAGMSRRGASEGHGRPHAHGPAHGLGAGHDQEH
jgi:hydrogenase nickel incorporation protein HypB